MLHEKLEKINPRAALLNFMNLCLINRALTMKISKRSSILTMMIENSGFGLKLLGTSESLSEVSRWETFSWIFCEFSEILKIFSKSPKRKFEIMKPGVYSEVP